jgi:hypothetical protein
MTETPEQQEQRVLKELEGKNIAHYSVLLSAWINTKMERDKTLVTLSAAAIGLLVTILTTVGVNNIWEIPLFVTAVSSFLVTIWSSLVIYQINSEHLESAIKGSSEKDPRLVKYDKRSIKAFIIGSISALLIGVLSASVQLYNKEENIMSKKTPPPETVSKQVFLKDSVDGITGLNPSTTISKSVDGIANLNPQSTQKPTESQSTEQSNTGEQAASGDSNSDTGKK